MAKVARFGPAYPYGPPEDSLIRSTKAIQSVLLPFIEAQWRRAEMEARRPQRQNGGFSFNMPFPGGGISYGPRGGGGMPGMMGGGMRGRRGGGMPLPIPDLFAMAREADKMAQQDSYLMQRMRKVPLEEAVENAFGRAKPTGWQRFVKNFFPSLQTTHHQIPGVARREILAETAARRKGRYPSVSEELALRREGRLLEDRPGELTRRETLHQRQDTEWDQKQKKYQRQLKAAKTKEERDEIKYQQEQEEYAHKLGIRPTTQQARTLTDLKIQKERAATQPAPAKRKTLKEIQFGMQPPADRKKAARIALGLEGAAGAIPAKKVPVKKAKTLTQLKSERTELERKQLRLEGAGQGKAVLKARDKVGQRLVQIDQEINTKVGLKYSAARIKYEERKSRFRYRDPWYAGRRLEYDTRKGDDPWHEATRAQSRQYDKLEQQRRFYDAVDDVEANPGAQTLKKYEGLMRTLTPEQKEFLFLRSGAWQHPVPSTMPTMGAMDFGGGGGGLGAPAWIDLTPPPIGA